MLPEAANAMCVNGRWSTVLMMLTAVLLIGTAVIFEPIRIGLAVLMLNRPRPLLQLLAFLGGGFAMGVGVGVVVLFVLRSTPLASGRFTLAQAQIAVGVVALLIAGVLATGRSARKLVRRPMAGAAVGGHANAMVEETSTVEPEGLSARMRNLLQGDRLWVAAVAGMATALPSANYMAALAVILASGASPLAQVQALVLFNMMAFALAEIPLVSYVVAPRKTRAVMTAFHEWIQVHRHREVAGIIALIGCVMLTLGVAGL
jgi:hypothetical protein